MQLGKLNRQASSTYCQKCKDRLEIFQTVKNKLLGRKHSKMNREWMKDYHIKIINPAARKTLIIKESRFEIYQDLQK